MSVHIQPQAMWFGQKYGHFLKQTVALRIFYQLGASRDYVILDYHIGIKLVII